MKKILLIFLFLTANLLTAQSVDREIGKDLFESTPKEEMFVQFNASLLFPGEYLYYKMYVLEAKSNLASNISKIAYLEMVGENGQSVFRHLIPLEDGQGHGDFFIPTSLPSGSYKLLGYTNWMRNTKNFFEADLVIINPYRGDQSALSSKSKVEPSEANGSSAQELPISSPAGTTDHTLKLLLDKHRFKTREKVVFGLIPMNGSDFSGAYSISVRKLDSIPIPEKPNPKLLSETEAPDLQTQKIYLPEFRGKLISGQIQPITADQTLSLANIKIAFSVPGEQLLYKVATTDEKGSFHISFDETRSSSELVVQIIGENKDLYTLDLSTQVDFEAPEIDFAEFHLSTEMEQWILDRSIRNQIENAYYSQKPDTIITNQKENPFYVKEPEFYPLDAYNRFPTIEETFVEIIKSSWIGKNRTGEEIIVVREPNGGRNYGLPALLLIDGVMVQDHSSFIAYPAKKVESIGILRDNFYIGSHIFEGIIDVRTFDGKFWEEHPQEYLLHKQLQIPEARKLYFQQTHNESTEHLPDLRTQLFWNPEIALTTETGSTFQFFTSDVKGEFLIEVQGFTAEGTPVFLTETFTVE